MGNTNELAIGRARSADLEDLQSLLRAADLTTEGFGDHLETAVVARRGGTIIGVAELEIYRPCALLRSVAVAPSLRGRGLGSRLVEASLELAKERGVERIYLLTETAENFFPRFGFRAIDREEVEAEVKQSVEFASACCESAAAMVLTLH